MIMSVFDKFCRLVRIKPTINVFRSCYHLIVGISGGNNVYWLFTFAIGLKEPLRELFVESLCVLKNMVGQSILEVKCTKYRDVPIIGRFLLLM